MSDDRFANVFTAEVTLSAANTLTFAELNFGMSLRDRMAVVIDEVYFYPNNSAMLEMTTAGDGLHMGLTISDAVTNLLDLSDRRIILAEVLFREDLGVAASGTFLRLPLKQTYSPPLIVLPTKLYFGVDTNGLASAHTFQMRMHYRTVSITQEQQLIEILESFQMST